MGCVASKGASKGNKGGRFGKVDTKLDPFFGGATLEANKQLTTAESVTGSVESVSITNAHELVYDIFKLLINYETQSVNSLESALVEASSSTTTRGAPAGGANADFCESLNQGIKEFISRPKKKNDSERLSEVIQLAIKAASSVGHGGKDEEANTALLSAYQKWVAEFEKLESSRQGAESSLETNLNKVLSYPLVDWECVWRLQWAAFFRMVGGAGESARDRPSVKEIVEGMAAQEIETLHTEKTKALENLLKLQEQLRCVCSVIARALVDTDLRSKIQDGEKVAGLFCTEITNDNEWKCAKKQSKSSWLIGNFQVAIELKGRRFLFSGTKSNLIKDAKISSSTSDFRHDLLDHVSIYLSFDGVVKKSDNKAIETYATRDEALNAFLGDRFKDLKQRYISKQKATSIASTPVHSSPKTVSSWKTSKRSSQNSQPLLSSMVAEPSEYLKEIPDDEIEGVKTLLKHNDGSSSEMSSPAVSSSRKILGGFDIYQIYVKDDTTASSSNSVGKTSAERLDVWNKEPCLIEVRVPRVSDRVSVTETVRASACLLVEEKIENLQKDMERWNLSGRPPTVQTLRSLMRQYSIPNAYLMLMMFPTNEKLAPVHPEGWSKLIAGDIMASCLRQIVRTATEKERYSTFTKVLSVVLFEDPGTLMEAGSKSGQNVRSEIRVLYNALYLRIHTLLSKIVVVASRNNTERNIHTDDLEFTNKATLTTMHWILKYQSLDALTRAISHKFNLHFGTYDSIWKLQTGRVPRRQNETESPEKKLEDRSSTDERLDAVCMLFPESLFNSCISVTVPMDTGVVDALVAGLQPETSPESAMALVPRAAEANLLHRDLCLSPLTILNSWTLTKMQLTRSYFAKKERQLLIMSSVVFSKQACTDKCSDEFVVNRISCLLRLVLQTLIRHEEAAICRVVHVSEEKNSLELKEEVANSIRAALVSNVFVEDQTPSKGKSPLTPGKNQPQVMQPKGPIPKQYVNALSGSSSNKGLGDDAVVDGQTIDFEKPTSASGIQMNFVNFSDMMKGNTYVNDGKKFLSSFLNKNDTLSKDGSMQEVSIQRSIPAAGDVGSSPNPERTPLDASPGILRMHQSSPGLVVLSSPIGTVGGGDSQPGSKSPSRSVHRGFYERLLSILDEVKTLLGGLMIVPAEIRVALWALRGLVFERMGDVDCSFCEYQHAYLVLEDLYGDPRVRDRSIMGFCAEQNAMNEAKTETTNGSRFGYGHPFGLYLTWKLGQIAYCRSDVNCIDRFSDIFRSLRKYWKTIFSWGPPPRAPKRFFPLPAGMKIKHVQKMLQVHNNRPAEASPEGFACAAGNTESAAICTAGAEQPRPQSPVESSDSSGLPPNMVTPRSNHSAESYREPFMAGNKAAYEVNADLREPLKQDLVAHLLRCAETQYFYVPERSKLSDFNGPLQCRIFDFWLRQNEMLLGGGNIARFSKELPPKSRHNFGSFSNESTCPEIGKGSILAFGKNNKGQLGVGRKGDVLSSSRVLRLISLKDVRVKILETGLADHSVCVDEENRVYQWGFCKSRSSKAAVDPKSSTTHKKFTLKNFSAREQAAQTPTARQNASGNVPGKKELDNRSSSPEDVAKTAAVVALDGADQAASGGVCEGKAQGACIAKPVNGSPQGGGAGSGDSPQKDQDAGVGEVAIPQWEHITEPVLTYWQPGIKVDKIAVGELFTMMLANNSVYTMAIRNTGANWGGYDGILGIGKEALDWSPSDDQEQTTAMCKWHRIEGPKELVGHTIDISAGPMHALCLTDEGDMYSWGWSAAGALGLSNAVVDENAINNKHGEKVIPSPQRITDFSSESSGAMETRTDIIVVEVKEGDGKQEGGETKEANSEEKKDGAGETRENNTTTVAFDQTKDSANNVTEKKNPDVKFSSIASGEAHNLAVDRDGNVWAWGQGEFGQLGLGTTESYSTPQRVDMFYFGIGKKIRKVQCGGAFSMAITEVVDTTGFEIVKSHLVNAAGKNDNGNDTTGEDANQNVIGENANNWDGNGENDNINSPSEGKSFSNPKTSELQKSPVTDVQKSGAHGGRILPELYEPGGHVYAWGDNSSGQCGFHSIKSNRTLLVPKHLFALAHVCIVDISCSMKHGLALDKDGRVFSWGSPRDGKLGTTSLSKVYQSQMEEDATWASNDSHVPTHVQSLSKVKIQKIAAGVDHSLLLT